MIQKLLIANRGEIACRIIRTAQQLGIHCVAIYSEADKNALHVKQADSAYYVGAAPSRDSYLNVENILKIAKQNAVDAIHPGYGFLSENPQFALACQQQGIIFVGPSEQAIRLMGDKSAAKTLMQQSQVPITPGYHGEAQDLKTLEEAAQTIGYPILIKAAAGGGGKGMRIVESSSQLKNAIESAQREAQSSFGDARLLLEKYLKNSRHIEIQIMADQFGNCIYLGERDCSIQRRHQKIIEEAPAVGITRALREKMGKTAVDAATAINYQGAGTIEFLLAENNKQYYFMEMNTRLQVEHPVTEMVTKLDLVELQLRIASGEKLELKQSHIKTHGHAIEVRIYAEDPNNDFLPSIGKIAYLATPAISNHVRIDTGIVEGDRITAYYDPMIAKLIVWDNERSQAIMCLQNALKLWQMSGIKSNIPYLYAISQLKEFQEGHSTTQFIDTYHQQILEQLTADHDDFIVLACVYFLEKQQRKQTTSTDRYSPWSVKDAWQLNQAARQKILLILDKINYSVSVTFKKSGYYIEFSNQVFEVSEIHQTNHYLQLQLNYREIKSTVIEEDEQLILFCEGNSHTIKQYNVWQAYEQEQQTAHQLNAPMPGIVVAIIAKNGQRVARGDRLLIIEAMKMEHTIVAPTTGIVKSINYDKGDQVEEGAQLLSFEATQNEFSEKSEVN